MSEQDEDFAAMFEASVKARRFDRGQTIEGTIVAFGPEVAFVSVGGKSEAQIDLAELKDDDGDIEVSIGDRIQAVVVSTSGGVMLSRKGVRNAATLRELENAFQAGLAVDGKVESAIKGGYEVRIARARAFCPLSQIDIVRSADPALHVGKTYTFRIIEYKDGGKNVVLSRRKHLEEQQRASAADVRPAPTRPASPTISPSRTVSEASSKRGRLLSFCRSSADGPGEGDRDGNSSVTSRPTIQRINCARSTPATFVVITCAPSRRTVTRSASEKISSRRWLM